MPHPAPRIYSSIGPQKPVIVDPLVANFNLTVGVWVSDGSTAEFGVEFTLDDPNDPDQEARWYLDPAIPPGSTDNLVTRYMTPIYAVRLNITTLVGSVEFKTLQGFN